MPLTLTRHRRYPRKHNTRATHASTNSTPFARSLVFYINKNTLTGPANCKKTTRHHAHLSLCAKSRKTNDAKSRKWPKASIWAVFDDFGVKSLQIATFSEK